MTEPAARPFAQSPYAAPSFPARLPSLRFGREDRLTAEELDTLYGELCRSLTAAGEARAQLLLARFALLAIGAIDDPARETDISGTSNQQLAASETAREKSWQR
ncbi:MAG TPA: hypothetical protein VF745_16890 [Steroidobacteraceae bacterium]